MSDSDRFPAIPIVFGAANDVGECLRCGGFLFWARRHGEPAATYGLEYRFHCMQCEPPGEGTVRHIEPWPATAADTNDALTRFLVRAAKPKA